jgi:hypothetical protein
MNLKLLSLPSFVLMFLFNMVSQATEKISLVGKTSGKICNSCCRLALFVALYFWFLNSTMQVCQHGTLYEVCKCMQAFATIVK